MAAVPAALDMTSERRGATTFDRGHGVLPRRGQRRAILVAKSRAEVAEDVRHFQSLAGHGQVSGGHEIRGGRRHALQGFQRTGRGADLAGGDTQISSRGVQGAMAEQQLDGAQIGAGL
jgi:hypothetical protein